MKLSLLLTINNRTEAVSRAVSESFLLPGNTPDECVVVLDRPTPEARQGALAYECLPCPVKFVEMEGPQGWLGPARAWNAAFAHASGELLYMISSEVTQAEGNVERARAHVTNDDNIAVFGACTNSEPTQLVTGFPPGLLASASYPRPLGFITAIRASTIAAVNGFDEAFMGGFWHDDDDLFLRIWHTGCNFLFDDSIHGVHLHHERPVLDTPEGQYGIARNRELMLRKHGTTHPWPALDKLELREPGRTRWLHRP